MPSMITAMDAGFETRQTLSVPLAIDTSLQNHSAALSFHRDLEARIRALPGVQSLAYETLDPFHPTPPTEIRLPQQEKGQGQPATIDNVLIDSRTGVSDTSGICTVQMPDDLVLCYTLNRQSMVGAAAAARSAFEQRRKPNGEPGLRVWPVSTRIELGESFLLASARLTAQQLFQSFIGHLPRKNRQYYWGQTEVQYQPYYAYEEVLAVFKDLRRQTKTLLADLESVTRTILNTTIELGPMGDDKRAEGLIQFIGDSAAQGKGPSATAHRIFVNYSYDDKQRVDELVAELTQQFGPGTVYYDSNVLRPGDDWRQKLAEAYQQAEVTLTIFGTHRDATAVSNANVELQTVMSLGKRVIPVLLGHNDFYRLPEYLRDRQGISIDSNDDKGFYDLIRALQPLTRALASSSSPTLPQLEDPQKGKWGGRSSSNGRVLEAQVSPISSQWFSITLKVFATTPALTDPVTFHLHPSFPEPIRTVQPEDNLATLHLESWGSFSLGVVADQGRTILELDLAQLPGVPEIFRER